MQKLVQNNCIKASHKYRVHILRFQYQNYKLYCNICYNVTELQVPLNTRYNKKKLYV